MGKTAEVEILKAGDVEILFYPNSHRYKVGEEWVTSVSAISGIVDKSAMLMVWATRLANEALLKLKLKDRTDEACTLACAAYKEKSGDALSTGTLVHEFCEYYIKSQINNEAWDVDEYLAKITDQAALNGINAFVDWINFHNIEWLGSERCVYSSEYKYVGTFDALARIDGVLFLIDFKTSKRINDEYALQTAGYVQALSEETKVDPKTIGRKIIRFDKETGEFSTFDFQDFENDFNGFRCALGLHNSMKKIRAELKS